jgi:hypothetical protein
MTKRTKQDLSYSFLSDGVKLFIVIGCTRDEFEMVIFRDCGLCL